MLKFVAMPLFESNHSSEPTSIRIDVFHDERILHEHGWLYHGMVFVPVDQEEWLIQELMKRRVEYDGFVHFAELRNPPAQTPQGMKSFVAKSWIDLLLADTRRTRRNPRYNNFCATVLGINLNNLNKDCFGDDADRNTFNRFFRTTLLSGINHCYSPDFNSVSVRHVFHGTRDVGSDNPLRWHPMWRIERDTINAISFERDQLTLIAADHRHERDWRAQSQIIQFCDVLLGATSQCLDYSSTQRGCCQVADEIMPVVTRLTRNPGNVNSRYYRKYSLSFFPSKKLSLEDLATQERFASTFYTYRTLQLGHRNQLPLSF